MAEPISRETTSSYDEDEIARALPAGEPIDFARFAKACEEVQPDQTQTEDSESV